MTPAERLSSQTPYSIQESFGNRYFVISSNDSFLSACKKASIIFFTVCSLGFFLLPLIAYDKLLNRLNVNADSKRSQLSPNVLSRSMVVDQSRNSSEIAQVRTGDSDIETEHFTLKATNGGAGSKLGYIFTKVSKKTINLDQISPQDADLLTPLESLAILNHLKWVITNQDYALESIICTSIKSLQNSLITKHRDKMFGFIDDPLKGSDAGIEEITNFFLNVKFKELYQALQPHDCASFKKLYYLTLTKVFEEKLKVSTPAT